MEEHCEVHPEEGIVLPESNKKRKFKTPLQLEELEKFYKEHTYPTEKLKADFAKKVGLSEKQVSGWFCHRRLKDKRLLKEEACANGRQDLSSGVIQDRGSGLKQDSCSSNKQGSYRHLDLREVESRRFDGPDYTAPELAYKRSAHMPNGHYSTVENTSSGSSSTSQERLFPQRENLETPYDMETMRYPSRSSNSMLISKGVKNKGKMIVSGYLHLQDQTGAIIAVKKQLGRLFREDGPPLGIVFQPLPPGAFGAPDWDPVNEPYKIADPVRQNSHGISKGCKEPRIETRYQRYHHEMYPQGSYPDGKHTKRTKWESVRRECTSYPNMGNTSYGSYRNHALEGSPAMDENSEDEAPIINSNNNFMRSKYGVEGVRSHSTGTHRLRPTVNQHRETLDAMGREENVHRNRRMKESENPVRAKKYLKNDMKVGRRVRADDFPPRDYVLETPYPNGLVPCRNQIKEPVREMIQTSFFEDDIAETSSSMD